MKINPTQLKSLRIQNILTSKQLAEKSGVSGRQISRIESSEIDCEVREYTAERLARALGVEVDTLADNVILHPGQLDGTDGSDQSIHPKRLRDLRERKKFSRRKLAERSGISDRQIGRIETSEKDVSVRLNTIMKLADALGVDAEMLVDDPTTLDPLPVPPSQDVQLSIKISSQVRLAYDLVKHRYGPSQKDIIKLAPLLYVLLAEGSLAWRQQWLEEAKAAMKRLEQLADERRHLLIDQDYQMEESIEAERESIERNDHVGDTVSAKGGWWVIDDYDTQFTEYLIRLSSELNLSGMMDYGVKDIEDMINKNFGPGINLDDPEYFELRNRPKLLLRGIKKERMSPESWEILINLFQGRYDLEWGVGNYQICLEEMVEISGNSLSGLFALVRGDVRVPEIPDELMTEQAKDMRVEWLESRMSTETQELASRYRELFAKDYGCDFEGGAR